MRWQASEGRAPLALSLQQSQSPLATLCNHDRWHCVHTCSCSIMLLHRSDIISSRFAGPRKPRTSASGMRIPDFFEHQRAHTLVPRDGKDMKTHPRLHLECRRGMQDADIGPEAVNSLGHQSKDLNFHMCHEIACRLRPNSVQESASVAHSRHVHRGFVASLFRGKAFIHFGGGRSGDNGRYAQRLERGTGCPDRSAPRGCFD